MSKEGINCSATQAPTRALRLTLRLDADNIEELAWSMRHLADQADRGEITTGVSGGSTSGWTYELLRDEAQTHEKYFADLRAYLVAKKAAIKEAQ